MSLVLAPVVGCSLDDPTFSRGRMGEPNVLGMNVFAEPESIDPGLLFGHPDGVVARQIFDGLYETDPKTLAPIPSLAESHQMSDDGLVHTFRIRPHAKWSDGKTITAPDVVDSFHRVLRPSTGARAAQPLFVIHNAEAFVEGRMRRLMDDEIRPRRAPFVTFGDDSNEIPPIGRFPPRAVVRLLDSNVRAPIAASVALHAEARDDSLVVGELPRGRQALVLAKSNHQGASWVQIRPEEGGRAAWARALDLRAVFPATDLRRAEGERTHGFRRPVLESPSLGARARFTVDDDEEVELVADDGMFADVRQPSTGRRGFVPSDTLDDANGDRVWFVVEVKDAAVGDHVRSGWVPARHVRADPTLLGIRAVDEHTLEIRLERPVPYFLSLLTLTVFRPVPVRVVERFGRSWTRPEHIVTSGAFHVTEMRPRDRIVLTKSNTFWDRKNVALDGVEFFLVNDEHTTISLYRAGYLDAMIAGKIPLELVRGLRKKNDYVVGSAFATYFTKINTTREPLNDPRVRRALALAVDRSLLTEYLLGAGQAPASQLVPPGTPGYPEVNGLETNVDAARTLLAEAGFPDGKNFPALRYLYNSSEHHRVIAEFLQDQWKRALNIDVELENQEWKTYLQRMRARDYDIARSGWIGDYLEAASFLEEFLSTAPNDETGWKNAAFDEQVLSARIALDPTARAATLANAERILLDETPVIPLFFYVNNAMLSPSVRGYHPNLLDHHPLRFVSIDDGERR